MKSTHNMCGWCHIAQLPNRVTVPGIELNTGRVVPVCDKCFVMHKRRKAREQRQKDNKLIWGIVALYIIGGVIALIILLFTRG